VALASKLDGAVEIEVPVEAVVVVADRGEEGEHHAPLPPGLGRARPEVGVLPEDAVVLLVQTDGVGEGLRCAGLVGDDGVQIGDVAEAVAAELERVGVAADEVLAGGRSSFCQDRTGEGSAYGTTISAMDARWITGALGEGELMEDQPLAGVEADAQGPVLPRSAHCLRG